MYQIMLQCCFFLILKSGNKLVLYKAFIAKKMVVFF